LSSISSVTGVMLSMGESWAVAAWTAIIETATATSAVSFRLLFMSVSSLKTTLTHPCQTRFDRDGVILYASLRSAKPKEGVRQHDAPSAVLDFGRMRYVRAPESQLHVLAVRVHAAYGTMAV